MNKRRHTKLIREGPYAAEVEVELIEADDGWSPPPAWGHPGGIPTRAGVQPHARFAVSHGRTSACNSRPQERSGSPSLNPAREAEPSRSGGVTGAMRTRIESALDADVDQLPRCHSLARSRAATACSRRTVGKSSRN